MKPVKSWSKKIAGNISIFLRKLGLVWHLWMCLDVPHMRKLPASFEGLSSGLIISSAALLCVLALAWSLLTDLSLKHVPLHRVVTFFENGSQEISYTDKCCKRTDLWGNTSSHEHLSWLQIVFTQTTKLSSMINIAVLLSLLIEECQVLGHDLGTLYKVWYQL